MEVWFDKLIDPRIYLKDIEKIEGYVRNIDFKDFWRAI